jgi:hypothetical protein
MDPGDAEHTYAARAARRYDTPPAAARPRLAPRHSDAIIGDSDNLESME